jgi:hypothetical protein
VGVPSCQFAIGCQARGLSRTVSNLAVHRCRRDGLWDQVAVTCFAAAADEVLVVGMKLRVERVRLGTNL